MLQTVFWSLGNQYIADMIKVTQQRRKDENDDLIDVNESITEDLTDKGFSQDEIAAFLESKQPTDQNELYKFVAYFLSLEQDYASLNDLARVIQESDRVELTEFTECDLAKILEASRKLE